MTKLLSRVWNDDEGAIISVELILVIGILVFGIIPGLVALRNSIVAALVNVGNALSGVVVNVGVDGIGVSGPGAGGNLIAYAAGFQVTQAAGPQLTTTGIVPTAASAIGATPVAPATAIGYAGP